MGWPLYIEIFLGEKNKKMTPQAYHPKDLAEALRKNKGFVSRAAKELGISTTTVYNAVKSHKEVAEALRDARERQTDRVESKMYDRIEEGSDSLIKFYLSTQGRDRGYGEKLTVEGDVKQVVKIEFVNDWRRAGVAEIEG